MLTRFLAASLLFATACGHTGGSQNGESSGTQTSTATGDPPADSEPTPAVFTACDNGPTGATLEAGPGDDLGAIVGSMAAGDLLRLSAGTYPNGLAIYNVNGSENACIFIEGPTGNDRAVFTGSSSRNTVALRDSSYVVIRNLELDGIGEAGDAVKAEDSAYAHHIRLENLFIHGHDGNQQVVGISTKCPAWNWVIRGNTIETAGTGLYLGNSDGNEPFVQGLIEHNVVLDTAGYNLQIKHQNPRPDLEGMPRNGQTIIRHNTFSKQNGGSTGDDARPNLLLGHWPLSGAGTDDLYLVYGNFFYDNPTEALMQVEGNVAVYANVMVNPSSSAIHVQPHNDVPRRIDILRNTIIAAGNGINVTGGDAGSTQRVAGNAVFSDDGVNGGEQRDNITHGRSSAANYLAAPTNLPGQGFDAHPLPDAGSIDSKGIDASGLLWADHDFDGRRRDGSNAGAYAGPATGGAWAPQRDRKP